MDSAFPDNGHGLLDSNITTTVDASSFTIYSGRGNPILAGKQNLLQQHHDTRTGTGLHNALSEERQQDRLYPQNPRMQLHTLNHRANRTLLTTQTRNESNTTTVLTAQKIPDYEVPKIAIEQALLIELPEPGTKTREDLGPQHLYAVEYPQTRTMFQTIDGHLGGTRTAYMIPDPETGEFIRVEEFLRKRKQDKQQEPEEEKGRGLDFYVKSFIEQTPLIATLWRRRKGIINSKGMIGKAKTSINIIRTDKRLGAWNSIKGLIEYRRYQIRQLKEDAEYCYNNQPNLADGSVCQNLDKEALKTYDWYAP